MKEMKVFARKPIFWTFLEEYPCGEVTRLNKIRNEKIGEILIKIENRNQTISKVLWRNRKNWM